MPDNELLALADSGRILDRKVLLKQVDRLLSSAQTAMQQAESNNQVNFLFYKADMEATGPDDLKLELEHIYNSEAKA